MRTRIRVLIGVVGIAVAVLVVAAPAFAQETEPHFNNESGKECFELAEKGGDFKPDDCQKAPSPLKPATNEVIWGTAAFLVLLGAMWKFGVPAVKNMEKAREDRIRNDLEGAEKARTDAESEKAEYLAQIAGAREEAGRIIEEARQSADKLRQDLRRQAEAEVAASKQRAQEEIEAAVARATADLRVSVRELTLELAEKVIHRNLDRETNLALIDQFIDEIAASRT